MESRSSTAVELVGASSLIQTALSMPVTQFGSLGSVDVRHAGLRGGGGARATFFFSTSSASDCKAGTSALLFSWSGTSDWRHDEKIVPVPVGAVRAVLQFQKLDNQGTFRIDNVVVNAMPNPEAGSWTPYHVEEEVDGWLPITPSPKIVANSALDMSFLVPKQAGSRGSSRSKTKDSLEKGDRIRFLGVTLIPPTAFLEPERSEELAERLARSGINLVRLGDLDTALGPNRSLFDDNRDDTKRFDTEALSRLDHLIAQLKKRGIYVALELQSSRRFRADDKVSNPGLLPPGGGPAAIIDPTLKELSLDARESSSHTSIPRRVLL